jgi:hypothetical protein
MSKSIEHLIDCAVLFGKLRGWPITDDTQIYFIQRTIHKEYKAPIPGTFEEEMVGLETFVTHSGIEFQCGYSRRLDNLFVCIA